jgi:hypothetical protein
MAPKSLSVGLIVALSALAGPAHGHTNTQVCLLHAGSTDVDVQRVLGQPTLATKLSSSEDRDVALLYADGPVRTHLVLQGGKVTSIALDIVYIDPRPLPERARLIKAMMTHDGVTTLSGVPAEEHQWTEDGHDIDQMTFSRTGEPEFTASLVDNLVVDVRPGHDKPAGLLRMMLPEPIPDASVGSQLTIGMSPAQAFPLLGPMESTISFTLKGQPVEYASYRERDGNGLVTATFVGGVLTAFASLAGERALRNIMVGDRRAPTCGTTQIARVRC